MLSAETFLNPDDKYNQALPNLRLVMLKSIPKNECTLGTLILIQTYFKDPALTPTYEFRIIFRNQVLDSELTAKPSILWS